MGGWLAGWFDSENNAILSEDWIGWDLHIGQVWQYNIITVQQHRLHNYLHFCIQIVKPKLMPLTCFGGKTSVFDAKTKNLSLVTLNLEYQHYPPPLKSQGSKIWICSKNKKVYNYCVVSTCQVSYAQLSLGDIIIGVSQSPTTPKISGKQNLNL